MNAKELYQKILETYPDILEKLRFAVCINPAQSLKGVTRLHYICISILTG